MNLTNPQRVTKVFMNLVSNPDLISPYFRHNVFNQPLPIDLGLPWWSYKAIKYVNSIIEGKRIFEYGTGGSTILFSKKACSIVSVEDDKKWMEVVTSRLNALNIKNVEIVYAPFDFEHPGDFQNSGYLKTVDKGEFDIIIIDGQDWSFKERIKCFKYVEPRMKPGQYIIVDDFWRYSQLKENSRAKSVKVFESVGPGRLGVTSTAIFSY